jgi:hypothetical protein
MSKQTPKELVSIIKQKVDDAMALTTTWEQNNVKWYKMRYRIKKTKNFPFVGCSNIRMPTIETKIRKLKAALVNVVFGIRPVIQCVPSESGRWETALKIEKFLDHLIMDVMDTKNKAIIAIDRALEKGFYLLKPFWNTDIITRIEKYSIEDLSMEEAQQLYSMNTTPEMIAMAIQKKFDVDMSQKVAKENRIAIEKAVDDVLKGKTSIELKVLDVICDYPDFALAEPERVYVAPDAGYDPQSSEYLVHEFELDFHQLKMRKENNGWKVDEILDAVEVADSKEANQGSGNTQDKELDTEKDLREGIDRLHKSSKVKIWECYGWFDINGDGELEKSVITVAPDFDTVVRKISLPFYSGKYPFVKLFYELTDDRWFSHRGIPELIEDIVKEIDMQHMQKLDSQTMRNTPMFTHRAGMVNKNAMQFIFGQSLPVQGMQPLDDIIKPLNNNNPNVEFSYEREQMLLETKVEELIGQVDFSLQSMINKRQPRTLGEVQLQNQNMQQVFSLDADLFRGSFEALFNWIWDLWCQYGDEAYEFAYFGKDGYQPIKLTKEEIQGKYSIKVRGNDQNTNPQNRLQKAQAAYMLTQNTPLLQMGVIKPHHAAAIVDYMLKELDVPDHEMMHEAPAQMFKEMQMAKQQPPPPEVRINAKDLTDAEMADVLQKKGIQPDAQGRGMKMMREVKTENIDSLSKVADMIGEMEVDEPQEDASAKKKGGSK